MTAETLDFRKFKVEITLDNETGEMVWSDAIGHPFADAQTDFNIGPFFVRNEATTNIPQSHDENVIQLITRPGPSVASNCYKRPTENFIGMSEALDRWNKGIEIEGSAQQERIKELFGKEMPPTKMVIAHPRYKGLMVLGFQFL